MQERGHTAPVPAHVAGGTRASLVVEGIAVDPDEALALRQPVDDVERRVLERAGDRVAKRRPAAELEQQLAGGRPGETAAQHPDEEGERNGEEGREGRDLQWSCRIVACQLVDDRLGGEQKEGRGARDIDRQERSPERGRGVAEALHEQEEQREDESERGEARRGVEHVREPRRRPHDGRVVRTVRAARERSRLEQHDQPEQADGSPDDADEPAIDPRVQPSRREREDQVREHGPRSRAGHDAEREHPGLVRRAEHAQEPEEAGGGEEHARAIRGATPHGDETARDERHARGDGQDRGRDLVLLMVARDDEQHRPCCCRGARRGDEREPAAPHPSRSARAVPESSAFAMKPRAPLCSISEP